MAVERKIQFSEHLIWDQFVYAFGIAAADLDKDGDIDITAADADGRSLYWFENTDHGKFRPHFIRRNYDKPRLERHAIGDINSDGWPDVVIVENYEGDLYWFENNQNQINGEDWVFHSITMGDMPTAYDVCLADFNGDGKLDVAASGWQGNQVAWFENPGPSTKNWKKHLLDAKLTESRTIRTADFDKDGFPDLLATGTKANLVVVYRNPGQLKHSSWEKIIVDNSTEDPMHGQPVDIDGDGDMDIVMAYGYYTEKGSLVWYENLNIQTGKNWKKHVMHEDIIGAFEAVAVDLDGDNIPEIAVTSAYANIGGLDVFKSNGDVKAPWKRITLKKEWIRANQVMICDVNGDGKPDIVAEAERDTNELRWWENKS